MANKRLLLMHEFDDALASDIETLEQGGFLVVHADHQDLFWPKFVETSRWSAIVVDSSVIPHIFVELASEVGLSMVAASSALVLISAEGLPSLPSSLKKMKHVTSAKAAADYLKKTL